jgi:uncharacterized protein (TIGR03437 family)
MALAMGIALSMGLAAVPAQAQTLSANPPSLIFTVGVGGSPSSQQVAISSTSDPTFFFATSVETTAPQLNWLTVSPTGGATPQGLTVAVSPGALIAGTYSGYISVTGGTGIPVTVPVTLNVNIINATPPSITFNTTFGTTPQLQTITITSGQILAFNTSASVISGGNWLQVTPTSGIVSSSQPTAVVAVPDPTVVPLLSPGTYTGSITITPTTGTLTVPLVVPVSLIITAAPPITVNPASENFNFQIGGTNNVVQKIVTLSTTSSGGVGFGVTATSETNPSGGTWVLVAPTSGVITSAGTQLGIAYNSAAALPVGTYKSTVTVSTPGGTPTKTLIPVTLQVSNSPLLNVPNDTLTFNYELGGANPPAQPVTVTATSGSVPFVLSAITTGGSGNWISVPGSGTSGTPFNVTVSPAGLAPGSYTGTVQVTGGANGPQQFSVVLKISNDPFIVSSLPSLQFAYQLAQIPLLTSQQVTLSSSSGIPLNYAVTAGPNSCGPGWLTASGTTSGTTNGTFTISVNPTGLSAGVCTGTATVNASNSTNGANAVNSPLTIPVKFVLSNTAELIVSPMGPAILTAPVNGGAQSTVYTLASTSSTDAVSYTVATSTVNGGSSWLQATPSGQTGTSSNKVTVTAQPGLMAAGTYTGTVTITATGPGGATVADSPYTIPVTFTLTQGTLSLTPTTLTFKQASGGTPPQPQNVTVGSLGAPLNWAATAYTSGSVQWLTVAPSGTTPGTLQVSVDASALPVGSYSGTVIVTSTTPFAGNSPTSMTVTVNVNAGTVSTSPTGLTFTQVQGGPAPPSQGLTVQGTPGAISFTAAGSSITTGLTVSVSPNSGRSPQTIQVTANAGSLSPGTYSGVVTITAANADGSPLSVPITINVLTPHNLSVSPTTVNVVAPVGSTTPQTQTVIVGSAGGSVPYSVNVAGGAPWFNVTPTSGNTPAPLAVTVNPIGLTAGAYSTTFTVSSPNAISAFTVTVNLVVGSVSAPVLNAVANAASYGLGGLAPGEMVVLFGNGIGPPTITHGTVTNGVVDSVVGGTRILFDGIPAPLIYVSSTQSAALVPYEVSGRSVTNVVVEYVGVPSGAVGYSVVQAAPGIFTQNQAGTGPGAILNADYTPNLNSSPAAKGSFVLVYMTGEGFTVGGVDGLIATTLLSPQLPVTATVGGLPATVYYAGTAVGIVTGAMQVNVQIPPGVASGIQPIVITIGTGPTAVKTLPNVTVAVQ